MGTNVTDKFDHIINWELKSGSHDFPAPNGGTCINEAAIVAAGFEYKSINSAGDCPPCFSRPISAYALILNDYIPDAARNELLMPFVTRLAGTADTKEVERARVHHMAVRTVNLILPIALRAANLEADAIGCEAVTTVDEAQRVAKEISDRYRDATFGRSSVAWTTTAIAEAIVLAAAAADRAACYAAYFTHNMALDSYFSVFDAANAAKSSDTAATAAGVATVATLAAVADSDVARLSVCVASVKILDEAIKLGNQGDDIAVDVAVQRMNRVMENAR